VRSPPFGDDPAYSDADASPTPEAGRTWAPGQLVFSAGRSEFARSGFADYAEDVETRLKLRVAGRTALFASGMSRGFSVMRDGSSPYLDEVDP
jgi:hypothetical protein